MSSMSLERLGGLALIVGPVLAFVMFLLQPGGILIDTAAPSDPIATINALADNRGLANVTVTLVCVGLVLMLFGLYALQSTLRGSGAADAFSRAGLAFIAIGLLTWFIAQGIALAIAIGLENETVNFLTPLVVARVALTIIGGMAVSLGFFIFALALPSTGEPEQVRQPRGGSVVTFLAGVLLLGRHRRRRPRPGSRTRAVPVRHLGRLARVPGHPPDEGGSLVRRLAGSADDGPHHVQRPLPGSQPRQLGRPGSRSPGVLRVPSR